MPENSVIIRHPRPEDLAGLQSLWAASFPEDCDGQFIPWYFQNRFQPENCWLLEQQGVLTAMCFAPEVHLQLPDGSLLPAPYIQGVATAAEKQRRGYCRECDAFGCRPKDGGGFQLKFFHDLVPFL